MGLFEKWSDNRYKSVMSRLKSLEDLADESQALVTQLRKRVMSLEGKYAVGQAPHVRAKADSVYKEVLEKFFGGKIIGLVESEEHDSGHEGQPVQPSGDAGSET